MAPAEPKPPLMERPGLPGVDNIDWPHRTSYKSRQKPLVRAFDVIAHGAFRPEFVAG